MKSDAIRSVSFAEVLVAQTSIIANSTQLYWRPDWRQSMTFVE
jgi:hypothetical protein